jgi:hypothetical protein
MTMKSSILMAAILLTATGASAAPPAEAGASEATNTQAAAADDKKICRTERATGSLTRRTRVCMTAAQWRDVNARTMRGVSEMQGQGSGGQVVQNNAGAGGG